MRERKKLKKLTRPTAVAAIESESQPLDCGARDEGVAVSVGGSMLVETLADGAQPPLERADGDDAAGRAEWAADAKALRE